MHNEVISHPNISSSFSEILRDGKFPKETTALVTNKYFNSYREIVFLCANLQLLASADLQVKMLTRR